MFTENDRGGLVIETTSGTMTCFRFPDLSRQETLMHGVFTRCGGFSGEPYRGLNVGIAVGDDDGTVARNREAVRSFFDAERLVAVKQVHGNGVLCYDSSTDTTGDRIEADAVLTDVRDVLLMIQTADCQPVLLFDPVRQVVGNVHSGWRGSVANIIGETVAVMAGRYGSRPEDIMAGIGPSLGRCCAEFVNYERELPELFWEYGDERRYFDFWAISRMQLVRAGLRNENISVSGLCTACNKDLFFSYRRDKLTGRLANVIGLKSR